MTSELAIGARRITRHLFRYLLPAGVWAGLLAVSELLWRWQTWKLRQLLDLVTGGW